MKVANLTARASSKYPIAKCFLEEPLRELKRHMKCEWDFARRLRSPEFLPEEVEAIKSTRLKRENGRSFEIKFDYNPSLDVLSPVINRYLDSARNIFGLHFAFPSIQVEGMNHLAGEWGYDRRNFYLGNNAKPKLVIRLSFFGNPRGSERTQLKDIVDKVYYPQRKGDGHWMTFVQGHGSGDNYGPHTVVEKSWKGDGHLNFDSELDKNVEHNVIDFHNQIRAWLLGTDVFANWKAYDSDQTYEEYMKKNRRKNIHKILRDQPVTMGGLGAQLGTEVTLVLPTGKTGKDVDYKGRLRKTTEAVYLTWGVSFRAG